MLDRKLSRDLVRLWAQGLAIALVMACGVATIIISVGAYRSLEETRAAFYDRYRFANIFASAKRVPESLKPEIARIPAVGSVEMRIVKPVLLDMRAMQEPASALVVSLPQHRQSRVNRLYLRLGRLPSSRGRDEVAIAERFAKAHNLRPGDRFDVIMNSRKRSLKIVGIVLSPEYIYAIGPGDMVPDDRRFAVIYMSQKVLHGIFDMQGVANDIAITTLRNADESMIIERLDQLLRPYGGQGAHGRKDQMSHAFLDAELQQLSGMSKVIPPIFLFVSAFLVNMILSRLITLERQQIGLLKALGYGGWAVGWHYAKFVVIIALVGLVIGAACGYWLGRELTQLYAKFFSFPFLIFKQNADLYLLAGGITVAAALLGTVKSIRSIGKLTPAVAMQPPSPVAYKSLLATRFHSLHLFSQLTTMALRHLFRWPFRLLLTSCGTALSTALLVTAMFTYDSVDFMIDTIFFRADRQDATISFASDKSQRAIEDVLHLPGVIRAEPFRVTPVKLRNQHREVRLSIFGSRPGTRLNRVLDKDLQPINLPPNGIVLSQRVAEKLRLRPGDGVEIEFLEKHGSLSSVPFVHSGSGYATEFGVAQTVASATLPAVVGVAQNFVGLTANMSLQGLNRLMGDGRQISGARILIDRDQQPQLYRAIKSMPAIASIALQGLSYQKFRDTIEENIAIMNRVYVALAVIMAFGVIYNSARIQLSERARELASLRVFGFTRAEVSRVLLTELAIIILLAQPLGWVLGYAFSWGVLKGFQSDLFRVPLVVHTSTFATASLIVLLAAALSALIVRRRINQLDLVSVLKTRE
ncbi:MAG: FtsX-like permease family protein [Rhizobiaceae bacterium]